jgi:glutamate-1-semialdehyde 2,1-aminomutase
MLVGYRNREVEAAVAEQSARADCVSGASPRMVELAELYVDTVDHADWAMFAKNGTDATTMSCMIARAATGRDLIAVAHGAYHGAAPWCTPNPTGVTQADRVNLVYFDYNDAASLREAIRGRESELAGVVVCPVRHDNKRIQELATADFAQGIRAFCDEVGALMIMDEVRTGLRLDVRGSWTSFKVAPDLSAMSKSIANGYALAAVLGIDALRDAASRIYTTGSFWYSGISMAAGLATLRQAAAPGFVGGLNRAGELLRTGLAEQARSHGLNVSQTGPVQIPLLQFEDDPEFALVSYWASECVARGVYVHPWHNWFISSAHTDEVIAEILDRTDSAFAATAQHATRSAGHA